MYQYFIGIILQFITKTYKSRKSKNIASQKPYRAHLKHFKHLRVLGIKHFQ